jgi:hypothetical protein
MELLRSLSFLCCGCGHDIEATVKCEGPGLTDRTRPVAAVEIVCPTCGSANQVVFEIKGLIRDVRPAVPAWGVPSPSVN